MKARRCVLLVSLLVLLGLAGWTWLRSPHEPAYAGRSLSQWLHLLDTGPPDKAQQAEEAVRGLGPAAVPFLVNELKARDDSWRLRCLRWANRRLPIELPYQSAGLRRYRALRAFDVLREEAASARPLLERWLTSSDPHRRQVALEALQRLPPSSSGRPMPGLEMRQGEADSRPP